MMKQKTHTLKTALFLHMGPGLNAHVERSVLSESMPHVHFWDQPLIQVHQDAFTTLVDAASAELRALFNNSQTPVQLIAHSFGGHLILPLLQNNSEIISSCELYSTGHNLPWGIFNLINVMARHNGTGPELRDELQQFLDKIGPEKDLQKNFSEMLHLVARDPHYLRHYWPRQEDYQKYLKIIASGRKFDLETFKNVTENFLSQHFNHEAPFRGSHVINIRLGENDPLLNIEQEKDKWKRLYPNANFYIIPKSGHFTHLEGKI